MNNLINKLLILVVAVLFSFNSVSAQKYLTKTGHISFFSSTPIEDIEAHNYQSTSVIDFSNGNMAFSLLMKGFEFEKALMQEHFNEKYVESDEYPKAKFKGAITNFNEVDLSKDGKYKVTIKGNMTIHGETKEVETIGFLVVKDNEIVGTSEFVLTLEDYKINIPSVVKDKIAKEVKIIVNMNYKLYTK